MLGFINHLSDNVFEAIKKFCRPGFVDWLPLPFSLRNKACRSMAGIQFNAGANCSPIPVGSRADRLRLEASSTLLASLPVGKPAIDALVTVETSIHRNG